MKNKLLATTETLEIDWRVRLFMGANENILADFRFSDYGFFLLLLFHKIRHTKPYLNGFPFFVILEYVVRDLIYILFDNEKKGKGSEVRVPVSNG